MNYAQYLEAREANFYRVRAYRQAAETVSALEEPVAELVAREGRPGLERLPGIGSHLSFTIEDLVRTGQFHTLDRLRGQVDPEQLLTSLPGVGKQMARLIHDRLGIATLEGLEQAAHDGRLNQLGVGPKRLRAIQDALAVRLSRNRLRGPLRGEPGVDELLEIDEEYRTAAAAHRLPTITPRRFNPENQPWLPLFQVRRGGWRYRVLFSNTALAHRLGQTHDWVVLYFEREGSSGQRTVVTETRGDLRGRRVVRGREQECRVYYAQRSADRQAASGSPRSALCSGNS
ncbi:MAG: helix-hairpin-helix domain-containing protein [Gemmataceae bacterium]|nr:helix-hairpin-helix domain-containing protein [Gemmataceae bacterium]